MGGIVQQAVLRIAEAEIAGGVAGGAGHHLHQAERPRRADHGRIEFGFAPGDGQHEGGGSGQIRLRQRRNDGVVGAHDLVPALRRALADQDGEIGIAQIEREIAQHAGLFAGQAFGQVGKKARGQPAVARVIEQEARVKDLGRGEGGLPPVAVILGPEKGGIDGQVSAVLCQLSVEAGLVLGAQRIGFGGGGGIARRLVRAAKPVARAAHGDGGKDGVAEGFEMADGGVVAAQTIGAIAREPFKLGEVDVILCAVDVMVGGIGVAGSEFALAHHVAGEIGAAVGPGDGASQCGGRSGAFGHEVARRVPEPRTDAPEEAFVGKARIIGKRCGNGLDQGIDAGLAGAERQPRLGQALPALGDEREHGAGAILGPFPEQVVEPVDVVAAGIQDGAEGAAQATGFLARHGDRGPGADRLGLGRRLVAAGLMGERQRQRARAGGRRVAREIGDDAGGIGAGGDRGFALRAQVVETRPVRVAVEEIDVFLPVAPAPAQSRPAQDVERDGVGDRRGRLSGEAKIAARQGGQRKAQRLAVGAGGQRRERHEKTEQDPSHASCSLIPCLRISRKGDGATHELGIPARHR